MYNYLITVTPPQNIIDIVNKYRTKYSHYSSYSVPPHITIYPPFYLNNISEKETMELLRTIADKIKSETLTLDSINYFENKNNNVAYFEPDKQSSSNLRKIFTVTVETLRDKVKNQYDGYDINSFTPHMTIADNIPAEELDRIKDELGKINEKIIFNAGSIYLYKKDEKEKQWEELSKAKFS